MYVTVISPMCRIQNFGRHVMCNMALPNWSKWYSILTSYARQTLIPRFSSEPQSSCAQRFRGVTLYPWVLGRDLIPRGLSYRNKVISRRSKRARQDSHIAIDALALLFSLGHPAYGFDTRVNNPIAVFCKDEVNILYGNVGCVRWGWVPHRLGSGTLVILYMDSTWSNPKYGLNACPFGKSRKDIFQDVWAPREFGWLWRGQNVILVLNVDEAAVYGCDLRRIWKYKWGSKSCVLVQWCVEHRGQKIRGACFTIRNPSPTTDQLAFVMPRHRVWASPHLMSFGKNSCSFHKRITEWVAVVLGESCGIERMGVRGEKLLNSQVCKCKGWLSEMMCFPD